MPRMMPNEYVKVCPYTLNDVLKMDKEELENNIIKKCRWSGEAARQMGWFDNYIGKKPNEIPWQIARLFIEYPYERQIPSKIVFYY